MKIGFDFHNVIDAYPEYFKMLAYFYMRDMVGPFGKDHRNEVHIISAIGPKRRGTIKGEVDRFRIPYTEVHELVFKHPEDSPGLKAFMAVKLGLEFFYDDRQDVCDALNRAGITCFKVPRLSSKSDIEAELV